MHSELNVISGGLEGKPSRPPHILEQMAKAARERPRAEVPEINIPVPEPEKPKHHLVMKLYDEQEPIVYSFENLNEADTTWNALDTAMQKKSITHVTLDGWLSTLRGENIQWLKYKSIEEEKCKTE